MQAETSNDTSAKTTKNQTTKPQVTPSTCQQERKNPPSSLTDQTSAASPQPQSLQLPTSEQRVVTDKEKVQITARSLPLPCTAPPKPPHPSLIPPPPPNFKSTTRKSDLDRKETDATPQPSPTLSPLPKAPNHQRAMSDKRTNRLIGTNVQTSRPMSPPQSLQSTIRRSECEKIATVEPLLAAPLPTPENHLW